MEQTVFCSKSFHFRQNFSEDCAIIEISAYLFATVMNILIIRRVKTSEKVVSVLIIPSVVISIRLLQKENILFNSSIVTVTGL